MTITFDTRPVLDDPKHGFDWVEQQFRILELLINNGTKVTQLLVSHSEPTRLKTGMLVIADGTDWDPGSGRGMYWYDAEAPGWVFIA